MNTIVGFLIVLMLSFSRGFEYKFQRDTYLMNGCPRLNCPGERIPSRCRMPTTYTFQGKTCRGCPRDFCRNNLFGALLNPDHSTAVQTNDVYNPLSNKSPSQTPEVFVAMKNSFRNPNYRYTPGDVALEGTNPFLATAFPSETDSTVSRANNIVPAAKVPSSEQILFNSMPGANLDLSGHVMEPTAFGQLPQKSLDMSVGLNANVPGTNILPQHDFFNSLSPEQFVNIGSTDLFVPDSPFSMQSSDLEMMLHSIDNFLATQPKEANLVSTGPWSAQPEIKPSVSGLDQDVVKTAVVKKAGC